MIITGAKQDSQDSYISRYDTLAAQIMQELLAENNIRTQVKDAKALQVTTENLADDLILICGPVQNDFSSEINKRLATENWFNGFYFYFDESQSNNTCLKEEATRQIPERPWSIRHREITAFNIPYPKAEEDYGLIFVGPNPINTNKWLILMAGLGAKGTHGAAKTFQCTSFTETIKSGLISKDRYISALIKCSFVSTCPTEVKVCSVLISVGSIKDDSVALA